jgi:hypothetical protein
LTLPDQSVQVIVRKRTEDVAIGQTVPDLPVTLLRHRTASGGRRWLRLYVVR